MLARQSGSAATQWHVPHRSCPLHGRGAATATGEDMVRRLPRERAPWKQPLLVADLVVRGQRATGTLRRLRSPEAVEQAWHRMGGPDHMTDMFRPTKAIAVALPRRTENV